MLKATTRTVTIFYVENSFTKYVIYWKFDLISLKSFFLKLQKSLTNCDAKILLLEMSISYVDRKI